MKADHLYVIGDGGSVVKIGRAADPAWRLSSLQVGSSRPLVLLHVFTESGAMERAVQGRFKDRRVHREWFDFGDDDPVMAVRDAIADIKARRFFPAPREENAEQRREVLEAIRAWGRARRALETERVPLVRCSLAAGITMEEIHQSTGLGRSTIDRIKKEAQQ